MTTRFEQVWGPPNRVFNRIAGNVGKRLVDPKNYTVSASNHHAFQGSEGNGGNAQFVLCQHLLGHIGTEQEKPFKMAVHIENTGGIPGKDPLALIPSPDK